MKNKYQMSRGLTMLLGILFTSFVGYAQKQLLFSISDTMTNAVSMYLRRRKMTRWHSMA